jgi:hypothetical protein
VPWVVFFKKHHGRLPKRESQIAQFLVESGDDTNASMRVNGLLYRLVNSVFDSKVELESWHETQ